MSNQSVGRPSSDASVKGSKKKWFLRGFLLALVIGLLIIGLLPSVLSNGMIKNMVTDSVNQKMNGSLSIQTLKLGWFSEPLIENVQINDEQGNVIATVKSITAQTSLFAVVTGTMDLGTVQIVEPTADIVQNADGTNNLQVALGDLIKSDPSAPKQPTQIPLTAKVKVTGGTITASSADIQKVTISNLTVNVDASKLGDPITLDLKADTEQGGQVGSIAATSTVTGFDAQGLLDEKKMTIAATADVVKLPLEGIDTIAGLDGLLSRAIGTTLDLNASVERLADGTQTIKLLATAQHLNANFEGGIANEQLQGRGEIKLQATPQLVDTLSDGQVKLAKPVTVQVDFTKLGLPTGGMDPARTAAQMTFAVSDGTITTAQVSEAFSWEGLNGRISSDSLAKGLIAKLGARTLAGGKPGSIRAQIDAKDLFDAKGNPTLEKMMLDAEAVVEGIPPRIIDALVGADGSVIDLLGEQASLNVIAKTQGEQRTVVTLDLKSDNLQAQAPLEITQRIGATGPISLTINSPTPVFQRYAAEAGYTVRIDNPITVTVSALDIPLPKEDQPIRPADVKFNMIAQMGNVSITDPKEAPSPIGPLALQNTRLVADGATLADLKIQLDSALRAGAGGQVNQWIGTARDLMVKVEPTLLDDLKVGQARLRVSMIDPQASAKKLQAIDLQADISENFEQLTLAKPVKLKYVLSADQVPTDPGQPTLARDAQIAMTITQLVLPLAGFDPAKVKLTAKADLPQVELAGDPQFAGSTLSRVKLNVQADGAANTATIALAGDTNLPGQAKAGSMDIVGNIKHWHARGEVAMNQASMTSTTVLGDLPLAFIEAITGQKGLVDHLGPSADAKIELNVDGSAVTSDFDATITTKRAGQRVTTIRADGKLANWAVPADQLMTSTTGTINLVASKLPAALVETVLAQPGKLVANVGPVVDVNASVILPEAGKGQRRAEWALASQQLRMPGGKAVVRLDDKLTLAKPFEIQWTMTPAGFAALQADPATPNAKPSTRLTTSTVATLTVRSLTYPLAAKGSTAFEPAKVKLDAGVAVPSIELVQRVDDRLVETKFTNLTGSLRTENLAEKLTLKLAGKPVTQDPAAQDLALNMDLLKLFDQAGQVDRENLVALASLVKLPVTLVDALLGADNKIVAALGDVTDGQVKLNEDGKGTVIATLDASNAKVRMVGRIGKDGYFRLTEALVAELTVTPELGAQLLQSIHPIFETAYTADQPIRLVIPYDPARPNDVLIPTENFDLSKVVIKQAVLDVGKLKMKPGGMLTKLNEFLKRGGQSDSTIWFTPLVVKLEGGTMEYTRRLDMLIDGSFHLVTWGKATFASAAEQAAGKPALSKYEMTLGVHASTLASSFGLKNIPPDSMFIIPVRGTTDKKDIDFGKAALSLGRLVAEDQGLTRLVEQLNRASPIAAQLLHKPIDDARQKLNKELGGNAPAMSVQKLPWADQPKALDPQAQPPRPQPEQEQPRSPQDELRRLLR